jgi:(2Fe-2S) ferredoxin
MRRRVAVVLGAIAVAAAVLAVPAAAGGGNSCRLPKFGPGRHYHPHIVPANFSPKVTNRFFPLTPGKTLVYTGTKDGERALDLVAATTRTRVIDGVTTRVVQDRLYLDNVLAERTTDYSAQDRCGNVWYFGEDTAELDRHGKVVSTEGTWHAGVDGAQPGVIMQAHPQLGRRFRQEWYEGHAEDVFRVVSRNSRITVPHGSFRHALRTEETNALEPDVLDNKYYVEGIGEVAELSVKGPREALKLVEIIL